MRTKLKEKGKKLLTIAMSCLMLFGMLPGASMQAFAENGGNKLNPTDISSYSFDIVDNAHGGAKIDYKTQGDSGYNDYLNNPSKFNQPVGKDQKESELSLKFNFTYKGKIKAGDTLEIPVSLGDEFAAASFPNTTLRDASGKEIGSYIYNAGKFKINFSKDVEGQSLTATLNSGAVKFSNTKLGTGTNGEKAAIYGKVMNSTIVAGYEKKNKDNQAGPGPLSLDDVKIKSFKIIDVANGNKEIDYRTSDNPQYNEYKDNPSKFTNAICENQSDSRIKLNMSMDYEGNSAIKEGDTLSIPMTYGGDIEKFASKPLFDSTNKQLGIWEYKDGKIQIKFSGDYIKNNQIKKFTASFETGEMKNYSLSQTKTLKLGDRENKTGKLGKDDIVTSFEKHYVKAINVNDTTSNLFKGAIRTTDSVIAWDLMIRSDYKVMNDGKAYFAPYMLEHNGEYSPKALTDIYIEDTFTDCIKAPKLTGNINVFVSGIDDDNKVISDFVSVKMPTSLLTKIEQGNKSREEVKNLLKKGEYCIYDNHDETYTLMMKWWNTNGEGVKFSDLPEVKATGGVGSFLKQKEPAIYGKLADSTITKINKMYDEKSIQNADIWVEGYYPPVKEKEEKTNTATFKSNKVNKDSIAKAVLTPPAGIADAPADPLSVKLIKSDRKTGAALSKGFKFELQNTKDNGTTWTKVDVKPDMLEKGSLDNGQLVPDDKGIVQLKKLTVGKYRFFEKAHPAGYGDVKEDNANPNSTKYPKSANSKVIELNNQGTGAVVAMYNEPNAEKVEIKVNKKWVGPAKDSVTVKLLADGKEVPGKTLTLTKDKNWEGKFTDLDKLNKNGAEIKYDVAEVTIPGYESKKTGDVKSGFTITNKNVEKINIPVKKTWVGKKADKVRVRLLANGTEKAFKDLDEASNWQHTFSNYPKYDDAGKEITYTVKEDKIEGYKSDTEGDVKKGFTITNTNVEKVSIPVEKKWVGKAIDKVEVKLLAGNEVKDTVILSKDNSWKHTFKDLPKYDKDGNKIKYDIEEVKVDGYITGKSGAAETGFTITNTITGKVSVPVTKTWIGKEGTSATVNLLADGKKVDSVVLNKGNNWQHTFANLEKYKDGNEISYIVEEEKLPLYDITMEGNAKDGFILKNTHVPPTKKVFTGGTTTNIDGKAVKPGQELTYSITYKNTKGKEADATITDKLPKYTTFVSVDNDGKYENGIVKWTKKVADGDTWTVSFKVKVAGDVKGEVLRNKAKVNDGENDYDTNEVTNPTPTPPEKKVFKGGTTTKIDGKKVNPGDELTYAVTYKNTTGEERDVTITDKLPKHTTFVSADNDGKNENGTVKWMKKVANGETWTVKFTVKVDKDVNGATLTNTARVNDGVNDSDTNTVKNPTPKTPDKPEPKKPHGPRTGDDSNIMLLFMLLLASGGGLGAATYMRRKRQ